jgi:undecaprenyl-diphosphatase
MSRIERSDSKGRSLRKKEKLPKKQKIKRKIRWTYFDKNMVHFFSKRRRRALTAFMRFMTQVGDGLVWFLLCVVFIAINLNAGMALTFASLIQILFQKIIKHIFVRQRPYVRFEEISHEMSPPDRFSFPSGHTAGAFVIAFVFYYFYPFLFIPMLIIASVIGFSRIYLGLHYPTDVLAGVILGFLSARLGIYLALLLDYAFKF